MRRRLFYSLVVAVLMGATPRPAVAWHDRGHMTVALIAYRKLDDTQKQKIQSILKEHPHYGEFLSAHRPNDAPLDEWVVMQAAIWPDWIRHNHTEFNKSFHHYTNMPIKRLDGASDSDKQQIEANIAALADKPSSGQILTELPKRLDEAQNGSMEPAKQAASLCWVLHLIGDIHQPLHAAALFTKDSLEGDRGGNAVFVPWNGRAENLHSIWDGVLGWDEFVGLNMTSYGVVDLMARNFQQRYQVTTAELEVTKVEDWAVESRDLADKAAYSFKGKPLSVIFNFDQHPHLNAAHMDPLPDGYATGAREVAERRVTLAGHRLGNRLKAILP